MSQCPGLCSKPPPKRILLKNGTVVNSDSTQEADVLIEDGVITQMGKDVCPPGDEDTETICCKGKYIFPGGIDPHTHLEFDFMGTTSADDFYIGTKAAVSGGTTMVIDLAFPKEGQSIIDAYSEYRKKADEKVCCDYALHVAIPLWSEEIQKDMEVLCSQHGINSYKMFMAYGFMLNDKEIYECVDMCKKLGAIPLVHAENGSIIAKNVEKLLASGTTAPIGHLLSRPEEVEGEAVNRVCVITNQVGHCIYIVHVMSESGVEEIQRARTRGAKIYGETLASALGTDGSHYENPDFNHAAAYVMSPPLRPSPCTKEELMKALAKDHLQLVGSDNCTFTTEQKAMGKDDFSKIPNGCNGVEHRMGVIWTKGVNTNILDMQRFVEVTSTAAARIFNIYPKKGCVGVGSDGDVVVWDPKKRVVISKETHHHAVDFNVFEGMEVEGYADHVIVKGRICVYNGKVMPVRGLGKFVETPTFASAEECFCKMT